MLKSPSVPHSHACRGQLTINTDAGTATAPRLPPMQGTIGNLRQRPGLTTPNHDGKSPSIYSIQSDNEIHPGANTLAIVAYKCFNPGSWIHEASTQQAGLSRACPERRVLQTICATLLTYGRVCFRRPQNRHESDVEYGKVLRDNGVSSQQSDTLLVTSIQHLFTL